MGGTVTSGVGTTRATSIETAVGQVAPTFLGRLLKPGDVGYEEARRVHNGLIDKRPALIARCRGAADVADAVRLGRTLGLEIAVRGGGHNPAGRAVTDGGLMIDLSGMRAIRVDPAARTARAEGGATWRELDRETQVHGLATTGGSVSSTGVAGYTLGGGLGWLMSKCGLAVDNLLSVDLVLADGSLVTASGKRNSDLFWAVRGGGGNFGVVTSFEFRLHPIGPTITGGLVAHPFEKAVGLLRFYRDQTATAPEELTLYVGMLHAPDGSGAKLAAIAACHCGPPKEGLAATRALKRFGSPVLDTIGPMPYGQMNSMMDAGYPRGALNYWKSSFLSALTDEAIDAFVEGYTACPSPMSGLFLEHFHGAAARVRTGATAFPHRKVGYDYLITSQWSDPADTDRCTAWARAAFDRMRPFMAAGHYVNYMDRDEPADRVAAAYGSNYARLRRIKRKYDPQNLFRMNQNIQPG
jgi:FAD/FMN-containing dehydrogenase